MQLQLGGIDLDKLPSVLAIPAAEYVEERDPLLCLWLICDLAELTLRTLVALAIADWQVDGKGRLSKQLKADIGSRIEQPTLGKWRGMALALAARTPRASRVPELYPFINDHLDPFLRGEVEPPTVASSMLELRNRLAHGGGMSRGLAARLHVDYAPRFAAMFAELAWLSAISWVVPGAAGRMIGARTELEATAVDFEVPAALRARERAVVAVAPAGWLSLWPFIQYGVPRGNDAQLRATRPVPQVYARRGEVRLALTPIGCDEVAMAEDGDDAVAYLKELVERKVEVKERWGVAGFAAELRRDANHLVGRRAELEALRAAVERGPGIAWVTGAAGIGKSYLIARLATDLAEDKNPARLVLAYRFKIGDPRCSRDSFLRFAIERLLAFSGGKPSGGRRAPLRHLEQLLAELGDDREVVFVVDGLDEVAAIDETVAEEVIVALAERAVWICAGRSERGLGSLFTAERVHHVFPDGVPGMGAIDTRAMLLDKVGPLSKRLLAQERDRGEGGEGGEPGDAAINPFVDRVVASAGGLPIYVAYVIGDVLAGRLRSFSADVTLPPSLEAYHGELLRGCAVGSVHQVLTPLVATLALGRAPLSVEVLHALLWRRGLTTADGAGRELIERGLAASASMLRRLASADGGEGYALFHLSLRDHLRAAPASAIAVATARAALGDAAVDFRAPADAAVDYLFAHGIGHLIGAERAADAAALLGSFAYLMARMSHDGAAATAALVADLAAVSAVVDDATFAEVASFINRRAHLLARGGATALLQAAIAEADDAAITIAAEAWLSAGNRRGVWWRRVDRPVVTVREQCVRTFEGHAAMVTDVAVPGDGRAISAAGDAALKVWDMGSGECLRTLQERSDSMSFAMVTSVPTASCLRELTGHGWTVWAVAAVGDGRRVVAAHGDCTLKVWDTESGACLSSMAGHQGYIWALVVHPDGKRVISAGDDRSVRVWDLDSGRSLAVLTGHEDWVAALAITSDGRGLVSAGGDRTLRLWDLDSGSLWQTLAGHRDYIAGLAIDPRGRYLYSASGDGTVGRWDLLDARCLARWPAHDDGVWTVAVTGAGERVLSGGRDGAIHLWDAATATRLNSLRGHSGWVWKLAAIGAEQVLSASADKTLKLWDFTIQPESSGRAAHTAAITALLVDPAGERAISASADGTLKLWQVGDGKCLRTFYGHEGEVRALVMASDNQVISVGSDRTLRRWELDAGKGEVVAELTGDPQALVASGAGLFIGDGAGAIVRCELATGAVLGSRVAHSGPVLALAVDHAGRRLLSAGADGTVNLWDAGGAAPLRSLRGHSWDVQAVAFAADKGLSASRDKSVKVWDLASGRCLATRARHSGTSRALAIIGDRVLSVSEDKTLAMWHLDDDRDVACWSAEAGISAISVAASGRVVLGDVAGRLTCLELVDLA